MILSGLGLMGFQFGLLARLTWWEYSWDIVEPITYFVTYGTAIFGYMFFVASKRDYECRSMAEMGFWKSVYNQAKKIDFDIERYKLLKYRLASEKKKEFTR